MFTPLQDCDGHPLRSQIDALPEVAKAVQGKCEVYLDGGIRSGIDILRAVGLGAKAVFVGRPPLWGLACNVSRFVIARSACVSCMSGVFNMCFSSHRVKMVFETWCYYFVMTSSLLWSLWVSVHDLGFTVHIFLLILHFFRLFINRDAPGRRVRCIPILLLNRIRVQEVFCSLLINVFPWQFLVEYWLWFCKIFEHL